MEINNDLNNINLKNIDAAAKPQTGVSETPAQAAEMGESSMSADLFVSLKDGDNMLADVLRLAGFKVTPENMKMIQAMIQNNLPVNSDTLKAFNQAVKLMGGDFDKALFLVKNEMGITTKNAQTLNSFANRETTILNELETLAALVEKLPDTAVKNHIAEILTGEKTNIKPSLSDLTGGIKQDLTPAKLSETLKSDAVILEMLDLPEGEFSDTVQKLIKNFPEQKAEIETAAKSVLQAKQTLAEIKPELTAKIADLPEEEQSALTPTRADKILNEVSAEKEIALEPPVKEKILQELGLNAKSKTDVPLQGKIIGRYTFKFEKSGGKDIDKLLGELKDNLLSVKNEISKQGLASPKILETADKITRNIEFLNEMKNSTFVQIPVLLGNKEVNAELYIFRDKRQKKGSAGGSSGALLSLDLSNLGHLEAYIQKENKNVSCQFRVSDEASLNTVKSNISTLEERLKTHGYNLSGLLFKTIDEAFTLISKEPVSDGGSLAAKDGVTIGLDAKA